MVRGRHSGASQRGDAQAGEARAPGGLTRRMIVASVLLALIVAGAFAVLLRAIGDARDAERRSDHSQNVLIASNALERLLLDLETGQRGFVLTGQPRFLEPWLAARRTFPLRARQLQDLVAGRRREEALVRRIVRADRSYLADYSVPLVNAARRGDPSARSVAATEAGKRRVDAIRVDFDRLIAAEHETATTAAARVSDDFHRAVLAAVIALGGSILLIALYAGYLTRAIVRPVRRAAAMAGRLAGGDLSARMPETGPGEVGALERAFNVLGSSLERRRDELAALADEQARLRRVATLVAGGASPEEVFSAVAGELGQLLGASITKILRFEPDGTATVVGGWSVPGMDIPIGTRLTLKGEGVAVMVKETGVPARTERFQGPPGSVPDCFHRAGARRGVGSPIIVEGVLWGVAVTAYAGEEPLAADSEARIGGFTELVATAIANAQAREELLRFADDEAALRRVATLVGRGEPPDAVFAAVAAEAGGLLAADLTLIGRFDDGTVTGVAGWGASGDPGSTGTRVDLGGRNVTTLVFETGRPVRLNGYNDASGPAADEARFFGIRSSVGAPITVAGRLWGVMVASSTRDDGLGPGVEQRLAQFTELVSTAIANAEAREELRAVADEQAALRRVATLVAQGAPPATLFATVAEEVGQLFGADSSLIRYDADGAVTIVGSWSRSGDPLVTGSRLPLGGENVSTLVFETGRPARIDRYIVDDTSAVTSLARSADARSGAGAPISVEGRLWGAAALTMPSEERIPVGTAERLGDFTELVATAIANAEAQADLTASRARIVATADEIRRRIERDLHDGAQQRLVSLGLRLRATQAALAPDLEELAAELDRVASGLNAALDELRELSRGIHPAILTEAGLGPALKTLARRSAIPVEVDVRTEGRLPEQVEVGAYYVVSEALANAVKHAHASSATVELEPRDEALLVRVCDDGVGGAEFAGGSGLVGLRDRVGALGGRMELRSTVGSGTSLSVELPLTRDAAAVGPER